MSTKIIIPSPAQIKDSTYTGGATFNNHITVDGYTIDLSAGATSGQILQHNGTSFVASHNSIAHVFTVGLSNNLDYSSIKAAVDAAITAGASSSNQYLIKVYPGTYNEDPMTIIDGITVSSTHGQGGAVIVNANNPNLDLFTMSGGFLIGMIMSGVTDPLFALVRCSTPSTFSTINNCSIGHCSNGIWVENGAFLITDGIDAVITGAGLDIGTALHADGYGTIAVFHRSVFYVPQSVISLYLVNPIQYCLKATNQAQVQTNLFDANIAFVDNTQVAIYADGGARILGQSTVQQNNNIAIQIGAGGSNTTIILEGGYQFNNVLNAKIDSATGFYMGAPVYIDKSALSSVPGATVSGLILEEDIKETALVVPASVRFSNGRRAQFSNWLMDNRPSGVSTGGEVTAGVGFSVNVAAGTGWINTGTDGYTVTNISWGSTTLSGLPANSEVFIYLDDNSLLPTFSLSVPGATKGRMAIVITDGTGIRYIHADERITNLVVSRIQDYLLGTRKFISNVGLGTTVDGYFGSATKINIEPGSYYRGLQLIPFDGYVDAVFSYFYGIDGYTEVPNQQNFNLTQYDNAGTLTTMTDGYFRSDTVFITSDQHISVVYGTAEYGIATDGYNAPIANAPSFILESAFSVAKVVVQKNAGIVNILDARVVAPTQNSEPITDHGQLSGLLNDDHPQYLLDNGGRAMSGALNMGTNDITNLGLIYNDGYLSDGVSVRAHAVRHEPGGIDAIATGTPVNILLGASPADGSASSLARADHQHGMSTGSFATSVGITNSPGSASSVSRSDHVHGLPATGTAGSYSYITFDAYGRETAGQLNSILTTARLTGGGDLSATRTLDLATTGVTPGTYQGIAIDAYGRNTSASLISVNTAAGELTGGGDLNSSRTLGLAATGTAGTYTTATGDSFTFDAYGRETAVSTVVRNINTTSGQLTGGGDLSANRTFGLAATGTPGSYSYITFDAYGRETAGVLNSILTVSGELTGGGDLSATRTLGLAAAGTAGTYITATGDSFTFDAYGRETSASVVTRSILTTARLTGGGSLSADRTLDLATSGIAANVYQGIAFDAYGRATSASLIDVNTTSGQLTGGGDLNSSRTLGLAPTGTAGTYTFATGDSITFDAYGRETAASTVTRNINTTVRLTGGGNLSADRTLDLATTGITPGTYQGIAIDAYGRNTTASLISINTTAGQLTGGGDLNTTRTLGLAATGTTGSYSYITFDAYGRETAGQLNSILTTSRLAGGGDLSATRTLDLAASGVSAATYNFGNGSIVFDAYGRATSAASPSNLVLTSRNINTASGQLTGGGDLSVDRTLGLATTTVTPGAYTVTNVTFDAYGRATAASSTAVGGTPVATSNANSSGSGPGLAYFDHVHQTKVDAPNLKGTTTCTTTSLTDVVLTDGVTPVSITPGAGNWLVMFSCFTENTNNDKINYISIYVNGVQVTSTLREIQLHTGNVGFPVSITGYLSGVSAGQAVDVRWRVSANTGTITNRELVLIRAV